MGERHTVAMHDNPKSPNAIGTPILPGSGITDAAYATHLARRFKRNRDLEDLANFAQKLGAVEYTSYVDGGLLCRRFLTPDGSIDLTVRVKR